MLVDKGCSKHGGAVLDRVRMDIAECESRAVEALYGEGGNDCVGKMARLRFSQMLGTENRAL
jgi:hypothetical protein